MNTDAQGNVNGVDSTCYRLAADLLRRAISPRFAPFLVREIHSEVALVQRDFRFSGKIRTGTWPRVGVMQAKADFYSGTRVGVRH